ncbi:protein TALPID3 isoform X2 [Mastacembelus armatus]|uniref:protein TALPID3 isoform X2 n=1 Tax=Mastacembelus armatus TaxID=205130 RepID=UPI000E4624AE|nr:protein TALPID3 isoform X2 [Mastacembelus armatus]
MFSPPASHPQWDLSGGLSPDQSSCSSDTGDVLIRSTRALLSGRRHNGPGSVQITVQKLRDSPQVRARVDDQQQRANPRQKLDTGPPRRAGEDGSPGQSSGTRPVLRKPRATTGRPPAAESSPNRKLSAGAQRDRKPGDDLLTSRFAAGGRGVVLAALKQRSHSAPHRREVRVQLLDPGPLQNKSQGAPDLRTSSKDALGAPGVQVEPGLSAGCQGDNSNAAASAAAAAVAAAAPLIKAQVDMEARVSQLVDGVQKLLQADRDSGDRGRSLSQQTLQHLETLHSQQLQLQNQLLESTLRIMTGNVPVTSGTSDLIAPDQPGRLQVTQLDTTENVLSRRQPTCSAIGAAALDAGPVAMATPQCPEQTRDELFTVSMATQPPEGIHLQSLANDSQAVARRANEVLREMGRLKSEMNQLLMPEDSRKTTTPPPDQLQSQQNQFQPHQNPPQPTNSHQSQRAKSQRNQSRSHQTYTQQSQSEQNYIHSYQKQSQPNHFKSKHAQSHQMHSNENQFQPKNFLSPQVQLHQTASQQSQSQKNYTHFQQKQSNEFKSPEKQPYSHTAQSQQTQTQSQQSHSLLDHKPVVPSMLEEAGQVLRQVRRQKKVLEENLEALLRAKTGEVLHCQLEALAANRDWTEGVRIKKTVDAWINTLTKDIQAELSSEDTAVTSQPRAAGSSTHSGKRRGPVSTLRETGSTTAGGRGSRQTVKHRARAEPDRVTGVLTEVGQVDGESYLTRLYGRAPYDGLRRTLKKSPYLRFSSPASPLCRKPRPRLVESVRGVKVKSCKTQTGLAPGSSPVEPHHYTFSSTHMTSGDPADMHSVPMAILLGRPRINSSSKHLLREHQQEVTSPPVAPPTASVFAMDDGAPEPLPQEVEQQNTGEAPPSHAVHILETKSEEEEDGDNIFPGTDFLSVADVIQQEVSIEGEEAVELDGVPSPPPVLYQGPVFPPQTGPALPAQDETSILGLNHQRDALEHRLVEWVEQQLMSRMISEMYHAPPSDPAHILSEDQSECEERSATSDIVEAAGGAGLQLFVDSNMSVDSGLIRQLVQEVLAETVSLMLGQRDTLDTGPEPGLEVPKPGPAVHEEGKLVPLVPTPAPTPLHSPTPPVQEVTPLSTPPPSEPTSLQHEESQPMTAPEHVATPTSSPEPTPFAGRPAVHQTPPPLTWEDPELPLEEERPEEHLNPDRQPLLMSVAEEEPPLSSPLPLPAPSLSPPPPSPDPRAVSPSSSSEGSSGTSSSSTVTAGTDAALKHISEGELLISVNQLAALTEETICSLSSSLHELQDMDLDPPSEGQVRGHELLLTEQQGERPQPEGSWGREDLDQEEVSVGEVRDDWTRKPARTTNPRSCSQSGTAWQGRTSSPGQMSEFADVSEVSSGTTNQGLVAVGDMMVDPLSTLTSDLSVTPPPSHLGTHFAGQVDPVQLRQDKGGRQQGDAGGARRMEVRLPAVQLEDEEEAMEESLSAADTVSSSSDVF